MDLRRPRRGLELLLRRVRPRVEQVRPARVAWKRYVSCVTIPIAPASVAERQLPHVDPVELDAAARACRRAAGSGTRSSSCPRRSGRRSPPAGPARPRARRPPASTRARARRRSSRRRRPLRRSAPPAPRSGTRRGAARPGRGSAPARASARPGRRRCRAQVEVLEDPLEQRERGLHLDRRLQHLADREQQPRLQRREGDDRARASRFGVPATR